MGLVRGAQPIRREDCRVCGKSMQWKDYRFFAGYPYGVQVHHGKAQHFFPSEKLTPLEEFTVSRFFHVGEDKDV